MRKENIKMYFDDSVGCWWASVITNDNRNLFLDVDQCDKELLRRIREQFKKEDIKIGSVNYGHY